MDKVLGGLFGPKKTPQEQLREWQRKLRQEQRNLESQVRGEMFCGLNFDFNAILYDPPRLVRPH